MTIERKTLPEQHYVYVDREASMAGSDIADAMGSGFGEVFAFIGQNGITPLAMPMSVYLAMPVDNKVAFHAGVLVSADDAQRVGGNVKSGVLPAGDVITTTHVGPYATLNQSHKALWDHMEAQGLAKSMPVWEIYVDDPTSTAEAELRTDIYRAIGD